MQKRTVKIGGYDTAEHGWTLTGYKLSDPEQKTRYVEKPGGDGSWDLSTVMTDGIPRYMDRSLVITLECSEGNRSDREALINEMVNALDGLEWQIVLPDRPEHYVTGRVHIAVEYNNLAHAAVSIKGTVAPWLYSAEETVVSLNATNTEYPVAAILNNRGRRVLVPILKVTGSVLLEFGTSSIQLTGDGVTYEWPWLVLTPGSHVVTYNGEGTLDITYREAVLR